METVDDQTLNYFTNSLTSEKIVDKTLHELRFMQLSKYELWLYDLDSEFATVSPCK